MALFISGLLGSEGPPSVMTAPGGSALRMMTGCPVAVALSRRDSTASSPRPARTTRVRLRDEDIGVLPRWADLRRRERRKTRFAWRLQLCDCRTAAVGLASTIALPSRRTDRPGTVSPERDDELGRAN